MTFALHLDLSFPPEWARIEPVRQAVRLCVAALFGEDDCRESIAMVSAELLENAVKYGRPGAEGVRLTLRETAQQIAVEVTNLVDAGSEHAGALHQRIAWLRGFQEPSQAYMAALAEVYEHPEREDASSGLGIVRIAYEGGCALECDSSAGDRVTVRARYQLPGTPPAMARTD